MDEASDGAAPFRRIAVLFLRRDLCADLSPPPFPPFQGGLTGAQILKTTSNVAAEVRRRWWWWGEAAVDTRAPPRSRWLQFSLRGGGGATPACLPHWRSWRPALGHRTSLLHKYERVRGRKHHKRPATAVARPARPQTAAVCRFFLRFFVPTTVPPHTTPQHAAVLATATVDATASVSLLPADGGRLTPPGLDLAAVLAPAPPRAVPSATPFGGAGAAATVTAVTPGERLIDLLAKGGGGGGGIFDDVVSAPPQPLPFAAAAAHFVAAAGGVVTVADADPSAAAGWWRPRPWGSEGYADASASGRAAAEAAADAAAGRVRRPTAVAAAAAATKGGRTTKPRAAGKPRKPKGEGAAAVGATARGRRTACRACGAHSTPQWRCGPDGPRTLCNACGVRYKKGLGCWAVRPAGGVVAAPPPVAVAGPAPAAE